MAGGEKVTAQSDPTHGDKSLPRSPDEYDDLLRALEIHQIELEMQNRELRETQLALAEGHRRYQDLYDFAPVGYVTLDREGRIQDANRAATSVLGISREELIGNLLVSQLEMTERRRFREHLRSCLEERIQVSTELGFSPKPEVHLTIQTVSTPLGEIDSEVVGCRTTLTDISPLKRNEERLALLANAGRLLGSALDEEPRLGEVLRVVVRVLGDVALLDLRDEAGSLERVEQAFGEGDSNRLSSRSETIAAVQRKVLATSETIFIPDCAGEILSGAKRAELEALVGAGATSLMFVPLTSRRMNLGVLTLASTERGRRLAFADVSVAENLASRIATSIDNARLYRRSLEATRARDEVLAFAAHDLRTPLAAIEFFAASLTNKERAVDGSAEAKALESVRRLATEMNRMIDDLLDIHSLDAGRFSVACEAHDIRQLFGDAYEALQPIAREKSVNLELRVPLHPGRVSCDGARVLQVLSNLVGNAVKFTPVGGTITIASTCSREEVVFTVSDTGPGVTGSGLVHLFDKYWQADEDSRKGRGLGLYISRQIVEAHGGTIWCDNRPEGGTAVSFSLPRPSLAEIAASTPGLRRLRPAALSAKHAVRR